jgi:hypothetical protein
MLDCLFDGSSSKSAGRIRTYQWTIFVGTERRDQASSEPVTRPQAGCGFLAGRQISQSPESTQFIQMEIRLRVQTDFVDSSETVNRNVRLLPNRNCGYGF